MFKFISKQHKILFIILFMTIPVFIGHGKDIVVKHEGVEVRHKEQFNFNKIPADERTTMQYFSIENLSPVNTLELTGSPRVDFEESDQLEFEWEIDNLNSGIIGPESSLSFGIRFNSNSADGLLKRCTLKIRNNFMTNPYIIELSGTAKSSGVLLFRESGAYHWKCPYNVEAEIEMMGGGQGGYNGQRTPKHTTKDSYGKVTRTWYTNGKGGNGGSSGSHYARTTKFLTSSTVYKITVGAGGSSNGGTGGASKIYGGDIGTLTAPGGARLSGQAAGGTGLNPGTYSGKGGNGGNFAGDIYEFSTTRGAGAQTSTAAGKTGSSGTANSGNGGGGGSGGNSGSKNKYNRAGGAGGKGGSGYVRIAWEGFLY